MTNEELAKLIYVIGTVKPKSMPDSMIDEMIMKDFPAIEIDDLADGYRAAGERMSAEADALEIEARRRRIKAV
jgi:hypothetical protein